MQARAQENIQVQRWITVLAIVLFAVKIVAWYLTKSVAILTDALESIANVVAAFIGLYSLIVSARPRDEDHPYGHGKVEFITAGIEGTIIAVAGIFIVFKAISSLFNPGQINKLDLGILLISITGFINFFAGSICIRQGKKNNSLALISSGKHLQSDTYTTIGILIGLALLYFLKIWWIDSVVAIIFAGLIIFTGIRIVKESIAGIMDEADRELLADLVETLNKQRRINWIDLHNVRVIKYGATLHIDCHLTVPWYFNVHEAHFEIEELARLVKEKYDRSVELFVHSDGCLPLSCGICHKADCTVRQHPYQKTITWTVKNIIDNNKHSVDTNVTA